METNRSTQNRRKKAKRNNRPILVIGVVILIIVAIIVGIVNAVKNSAGNANTERNALSISRFEAIMEKQGYQLFDSTDQYSDYSEYIKKCSIAIGKYAEYQIEFYELTSNENALALYDENRATFETVATEENPASVDENSDKYSKYVLAVSGRYMVLSRIDNTVVYADVNDDYRAKVENALKVLGY